MTMPINMLSDPKMRKTLMEAHTISGASHIYLYWENAYYIHLGRPEVMCPTAYPIRPPNIVAIPFVQ